MKNLLYSINTIEYHQITHKLWSKAVQNGFIETVGDDNQKKYKYGELPILKEDAAKIKKMDAATIQRFVDLQNEILEVYPYELTAVIDYREGKVLIIKYD